MIKIQDIKFQEKFTELNIRHRLYKDKPIVTLIINTEFYPAEYKGNVVSGALEAKVDIEDIRSLDDLVDKTYKGDIGSVTISVNNDGVWEHESKNDFEINIKTRKNRELEFVLSTDNCELNTKGILVSLYTTSTSQEQLTKEFDMKDFYEKPHIREIGNNKVYKYFVQE